MSRIDSTLSRLTAALVILTVLAGCAAPPAEKVPVATAVFYPEAPEPPRIQHLVTFTGERNFQTSRGGFATFVAGEAKGHALLQVYGVALAEGRLYAVDTKGAGIAVFDLVNRKFSVFTGSGGGRLKTPINLTIDTDGTKFVTDTGRDKILVFDRDNRYVGAFGEPGQFRPVDTAVMGDKLYVVDIKHHQVQVLDKRTGKALFKFGKAGSGPGELFHPTNIAIGPNGDVYVAETNNFRVQRFSAEGQSLQVIGQVGDKPGSFARPKGLAIDRQGRIYVGDAAFQNVQVFDSEGGLLMAFGQPKEGEGLSLPAGVAIDYDNVALFKQYADPSFDIEYLILVASQIAPNKVDVFGFGRKRDVEYAPGKSDPPAPGR